MAWQPGEWIRGVMRPETTLRLGSRYARTIRWIDTLRTSRLWNLGVLAPWREARVLRAESRREELAESLALSYGGLLAEIFHWSCRPDLRGDRGAVETFASRSWRRLDNQLRKGRGDQIFAATLWQTLCDDCNIEPGRIGAFKPKFMLRQFVDEIADENRRDVLVFEAYHGALDGTRPKDISESSAAIRGALTEAYEELRKVIEKYPDDLAAMTDSVITGYDLDGLKEKFEDWLFPRVDELSSKSERPAAEKSRSASYRPRG